MREKSPESPVIRMARGTLELLGSYGLASAIFVGLLTITYLGTLDQIEHGLLHAHETYFHAFVAVPSFGGIPIVLPGAYTLLTLLAINILCGALLRLRRDRSQIGTHLVHAGAIVLLLGGVVGSWRAVEGAMILRPGETVAAFTIESEWEVVLRSEADHREFIFSAKNPDQRAPGNVELFGFQENALPVPAGPAMIPDQPLVDGFFLQPMPDSGAVFGNEAGVYLRAESNGGATNDVLLWAGAPEPAAFEYAGETWCAELRRKRWPLPFALTLASFEREVHPGTGTPRAFQSDLIRTEADTRQRVVIAMNSPMRHGGYTFYQSSWGPQNAAPGVPLYSVLAVSKNPADRVPVYACMLIALGMVFHFTSMLSRLIRRKEEGRIK